MAETTEKKEFFTSRWGMILAVIGIAVGTGNIWRFSRIVAQNGGGSFLIPWVIFLLIWSVPLIIAEFAIGKYTRYGTIGGIAKLAGEKATKDRISAVGFGIAGAFLVFLGGLARIASNGSRDTAASNPDTTIGVLIWLTFYGILLVVLLTEPTILHRALRTNAFHLPIEPTHSTCP